MELVELIIARKIGLMEQEIMTRQQATINEVMYRLDLVRHRLELKWGVRRLEELSPHELRSKWDAQMSKLNEAIMASDVALVEELVSGAIRGWDALERSAISLGHVPFEPLFWEVPMDDGTVYRVVRTMEDSHGLIACAERPVIALCELVRVYHARHKEAFVARPGDELRGEYVKKDLPMDQPLGF